MSKLALKYLKYALLVVYHPHLLLIIIDFVDVLYVISMRDTAFIGYVKCCAIPEYFWAIQSNIYHCLDQGFSNFFLPFTPCQLPNIKFSPCFLFTL